MRNALGWIMFLLFNLVLAAGVIYIVGEHASTLWTLFWSALAVFTGYAVFLAVWLIAKVIRLRFANQRNTR